MHSGELDQDLAEGPVIAPFPLHGAEVAVRSRRCVFVDRESRSPTTKYVYTWRRGGLVFWSLPTSGSRR